MAKKKGQELNLYWFFALSCLLCVLGTAYALRMWMAHGASGGVQVNRFDSKCNVERAEWSEATDAYKKYQAAKSQPRLS